MWRIPEAEVGALGDVDGADVLEYGCGAAQWSIVLARRGAHAASGSTSRDAQLRHARVPRMRDAPGVAFPLVCASGEHVPARRRVVRRRVLRPRRDVVLRSRRHPARGRAPAAPRWALRVLPLVAVGVRHLRRRRRTGPRRRLRRPYFGLRTVVEPEGTVDFVLPTGEWVRAFRAAGLVIDDLIELRAPKGATHHLRMGPRAGPAAGRPSTSGCCTETERGSRPCQQRVTSGRARGARGGSRCTASSTQALPPANAVWRSPRSDHERRVAERAGQLARPTPAVWPDRARCSRRPRRGAAPVDRRRRLRGAGRPHRARQAEVHDEPTEPWRVVAHRRLDRGHRVDAVDDRVRRGS